MFETMLLRDGAVLRVGAHLRRLADSAEVLYAASLPVGLSDRIEAVASGHGAGTARLKVAVRPAACSLDVEVTVAPAGARAAPVALLPVTVPGGLGAHKWLDRSLLDRLTADAQGATPLLVDEDGHVLEAAWGNVFLLEDDLLSTPYGLGVSWSTGQDAIEGPVLSVALCAPCPL